MATPDADSSVAAVTGRSGVRSPEKRCERWGGALDGAVGPDEGGAGTAAAQPPVQIGTGCGGDDDGAAALDLALLGRGRRDRGDQGETPGGEVVEPVGGVDGGVRA